VPASAGAASLSQVSGWASGVPSYISMYEYVPANVVASPPIVVAAHYCGGSASSYFTLTGVPGVVSAADQYGFIMIFPQTSNNCWDVGSTAALTRNGGGDTQAIAEMVQYEIAHRNGDPNRVYIFGSSTGGMLTQAMLGIYPDVFKAGSSFSGVPVGCWAVGYTASNNWSSMCAGGQVTHTPQDWATIVHNIYAYSGTYPRIQLWQGTSDTTINPVDLTESIKQWAALLGVSPTAPTTTTTVSNFTIQQWQSPTCAYTVLESHSQASGGHPTPVDPTSIVSFFGLDKTGPDP